MRARLSIRRWSGRRWLRWLGLVIVVVAILAVGIPFIYIHLIEGKAPPKLRLTPSATDAGGSGSGNLSGSWGVTSGSIVGYRVSETLIGQHNTAVGRTSTVAGTVDISGTTARTATFTVAMATVKSDESQRDSQFDGRIMDVANYPTGTFRLTSPISLTPALAVGVIRSYHATGRLTLHGQTHPVSFTINAERTADQIEVQGDINVLFSTWGISNPSVGGFVTTASNGTLEFLLHLQRGVHSTLGSIPTTTTPSGFPSGGAGGPGGGITVPATTVPPLTLGH